MRTKTSIGVLATLGALAIGLGVGATQAATTTPSSRTPGLNRKIAALVPAKYRSKGKLTVAADATYPPNEFVGSNGHTVVGMDPDLGMHSAACSA